LELVKAINKSTTVTFGRSFWRLIFKKSYVILDNLRVCLYLTAQEIPAITSKTAKLQSVDAIVKINKIMENVTRTFLMLYFST
jgi:6,7-dimethyl-8-ribityllumazine synthase